MLRPLVPVARCSHAEGRSVRWGSLAVVLLALGVLALPGCYNSKNILFKDKARNDFYKAERKRTHKAVIVYNNEPLDSAVRPYALVPGDIVVVQFVNVCRPVLISLGGETSTAEVTATGVGQVTGRGGQSYTVDEEGMIALPLFGRIRARNLTARQLRDTIEARINAYCVGGNATLDLRITTLRAFVFNEGGVQGLINLPSERTHISEFLALAGGVSFLSKTQKLQIIRGVDARGERITKGDLQSIWVDLRQLDALRNTDLWVYPNDIIYIEPRDLPLLAREVQTLTLLTASLSFVISLVLIFRVF